jgi:UPF0271 protein
LNAGIRLMHVKPHGALYNVAVRDRRVADAIAGAVASIDRSLVLVGPAALRACSGWEGRRTSNGR